MLNMSNLLSNRNSTPEATSISTLRPPSSRAVGASANPALRASADMAVMTGQAGSSRIRPSSDFYGQPQQGHGQAGADLDPQDKLAQQWIAEIDQYENTLEEMAAATLDQDFKDELSAIEQWFRVLSEAERTAALYALLQQTTQVQIRFFIQVLQQMGKNHPVPGVLSPANFDKDPMSTRLNDAMNKMNSESARTSLATRGSVKRQSGLDPTTINAMFPDAAKAIATEKAKFTQQTGNPPTTNRNSAVLDNRNSLVAPGLTATKEESNGPRPSSPWTASDPRPKSASGHAPMGQFVQPPASGGGLRSPRPQITSNNNIQNTTLTLGGEQSTDSLLSPYTAGGNWASMVNTPSNPNFAQNSPAGVNNADMVANATAMKLAALSTVNNRFALDEVRKFRRNRSSDAPGGTVGQPQVSSLPNHGTPIVMLNEAGHVLSREALMAIQQQQQQQLAAMAVNRSRPGSPGLLMQASPGLPVQNYGPALAFTSPQNNGFLAAGFDGFGMGGGMGSFSMGGVGGGHEGYLSDHSDMHRGRSPRGRRATSRSAEDPTDPALLQDIPSWLRSLRLHKYTDNLKDLKWTELVELDDEKLEQRGVNALGARRKMLKVFEQVREAKTTGKL